MQSGATVSTVSAGPYTHTFALLNSPSVTEGRRGAAADPYPDGQHEPELRGQSGDEHQRGASLRECRVSASVVHGNADALLDIKVTGNSWVSARRGAAPTNTVSNVIPVANWRASIYIGGTAAGNQVAQIGEWALTVKRQTADLFHRAERAKSLCDCTWAIVGHVQP